MSSPEVKTSNQSEIIRKHKEFLFPAVATYYQEPLALVKGEGAHVWDDKGDKYLDCLNTRASAEFRSIRVRSPALEQRRFMDCFANEHKTPAPEAAAALTNS